MAVELYIPGKPIAKKRPRFAMHGKFVVTYNDQETEEGRFLWELKNQWKEPPMGGPIRVGLYFTMPIPASISARKREAMIENMPPHIKKPDLDNLIKFVKDCMNGVVWHDDAQVCEIIAGKNYGANPCTRIVVEDFDEN